MLKVDGVEATTATEGKTVTIVCTGKGAYVQKTVIAHMTGDTTKVVKVTNNTFTMPDYNVTVNVTFGKATNYNLTCTASTNGSYELYVDDSLVSSQTYGGAVVTVKPKPNTNYMLDTITVYKTGDKDTTVTVTDNKFTMPAYDATIEVTFKPSSGYEYPLKSTGATNGSFELKVGSTVVSKAASGKTVTVAYTANTNYKLDAITISYYVWNDDTGLKELKEVKVSNAKFTMPTFDDEIAVADRYVNVEVTFILSKVYTITINTDTAKTGNTVTAHVSEVNGTTVTKTEQGRKIVLVPKISKTGYELDSIVVKNASTNAVIKTISNSDLATDASFTMPGANVTVTPTYKAATQHNITFAGLGNAVFTVKGTSYAVNTGKGYVGDTVNMTITPGADRKLTSVKAEYVYSGETLELTISGNNFTMPAFDVAVTGTFDYVNHVVQSTGSEIDVVTYTVNSQTVADGSRVAAGDNVIINATMNSGYEVKEIKVTYVDSKSKTQEVTVKDNVFVMPDYDVTVTITPQASSGSYAINIVDTENGTVKVVEEANKSVTRTRANENESLTIVAEPSTYHEVDTITVTWSGGNVTVYTDTFKMPKGDVEVTVTFKAKTYKLSKITVADTIGEIKITDADGKEITEAQYGDTVKITATPASKYKLTAVGAKNKETGIVYVTTTSFQMPAFDVEVYAEFEALKTNLEITANEAVNGTYKLQVSGADVTTADEGDKVSIVATPNSGYAIGTITVVKTASGDAVTVSGYSFTMPSEAVTVTVTFVVG